MVDENCLVKHLSVEQLMRAYSLETKPDLDNPVPSCIVIYNPKQTNVSIFLMCEHAFGALYYRIKKYITENQLVIRMEVYLPQLVSADQVSQLLEMETFELFHNVFNRNEMESMLERRGQFVDRATYVREHVNPELHEIPICEDCLL